MNQAAQHAPRAAGSAAKPPTQGALLHIENLKKHFPVRSGFWQRSVNWVHAVDSVTFDIMRGEVFGLVGETGCGKSTLAQVIVGIYPPTAGRIELDGVDLSDGSARRSKATKRKVQIVFQDPFWSLNPRKMIRDIIGEPLVVHKIAKPKSLALVGKVSELLEMVGIDRGRLYSYPHEFSGGERQRVAIARALALNPSLLLLDEPTSSIDTLSQAEILNLLIEIRNRFNLSYVLISHDLSVVQYLSDRIAVMYLGKIVEIGRTAEVFGGKFHPYTEALMRAVPMIHASGEVGQVQPLEGNVPSAINPPPGCRFAARCYKRKAVCTAEEPPLRDVTGGGHFVACHFPNL